MGFRRHIGSYVKTDDPRLSDDREWTAITVSEDDAKKGINDSRTAWTPIRVRDAINGWWNELEYQPKIDNIEDGAQVNTVNSVNNKTGEITISPSDLGLEKVPNINTTNANNISTGTLSLDRLPNTVATITTGEFIPYFRTSESHIKPTMTKQKGKFTIVGNVCFIDIKIDVSSGLSDNSQLRIYGLPVRMKSGIPPMKLHSFTKTALKLAFKVELEPVIVSGAHDYITLFITNKRKGTISNLKGSSLKNGSIVLNGFYFI